MPKIPTPVHNVFENNEKIKVLIDFPCFACLCISSSCKQTSHHCDVTLLKDQAGDFMETESRLHELETVPNNKASNIDDRKNKNLHFPIACCGAVDEISLLEGES